MKSVPVVSAGFIGITPGWDSRETLVGAEVRSLFFLPAFAIHEICEERFTSQFTFSRQKGRDFPADPTLTLLDTEFRWRWLVGEIRKFEIKNIHEIIRTCLSASWPAKRSHISRSFASLRTSLFSPKRLRISSMSLP